MKKYLSLFLILGCLLLSGCSKNNKTNIINDFNNKISNVKTYTMNGKLEVVNNDDIFISIMNQYTPIEKYPFDNLNNKLTEDEYEEVINYALTIGVKNAFIQEGESSTIYIPKFDKSVV